MKKDLGSYVAAVTVACITTAVVVSVPGLAHATSSAELYDSNAYRFGRFEARIQYPAPDGVVGAFFLWKDGSELSGAYWNELDFEKIKATCQLQVNSIYGMPMANHSVLANGLSDLCTGYHTYLIEWTPTSIAWKVDGNEVRRDDSAAAVQAYLDNAKDGMHIHFNVWPGSASFGGTFSTSSLPTYQFISWVAYSAFTPGSGDGGGDFTLVWRESFENGIPSTWSTGNWSSPMNLSTHAPANVTTSGGVAVLGLTADDATGFTGTPPTDSGDMPSVTTGNHGTGGAGTGGAGTGGASGPAGSGGSSATGGSNGGQVSGSSSGGCAIGGAGRDVDLIGGAAAIAVAIFGWSLRRRRGHAAGGSI